MTFVPTLTNIESPFGVVTTTTRLPGAAPLETASVAVSVVPSALTDKLVATMLVVSSVPLELMNLRLVAPERLTPLNVTVTVAPLDTLLGEIALMYGPVVAETAAP